MQTLALILCFLALWAGVTLVLSSLAEPVYRRSLAERLEPYVQRGEQIWTDEIEAWLHGRTQE